MREAVIVSTARTPIGKAYRGAFNNLESPTMGGIAIREAVKRAGLEHGEVDDVIMGCAMQQGTQGFNTGRQCSIEKHLRLLEPMETAREPRADMERVRRAGRQCHGLVSH